MKPIHIHTHTYTKQTRTYINQVSYICTYIHTQQHMWLIFFMTSTSAYKSETHGILDATESEKKLLK